MACWVHCGAITFLLTRASGPAEAGLSPLLGPGELSLKLVIIYHLPQGWGGGGGRATGEEHQENHGKQEPRRPLEHPVQGSHREYPWIERSG